MAPALAVIAALPREIAGLVGRAKPDPSLASRGIALYRVQNGLVAAAGMGRVRVSLAVEACLLAGDVQEIVSVGLAGACTPALRPGELAEPTLIADVRTGERFAAAGEPRKALVLASADTIASIAEKARLASAYGAALVDMEAATVARLAAAHGLRFRAVKGISDAHDLELASLARFAGPRGQFRTAAFAVHTALRPGQWRVAATLGRHSKQALAAMTARLQGMLAEAR